MSDSSSQLQNSLDRLAHNETALGAAEVEAEAFRISKTQPIYLQRSQIVSTIPKFWYIVLAENEDFVDYVAVEDLKYIEDIKNIEVSYNTLNIREFSITFTFSDQTVTKSFETVVIDGEERITSEPTTISWPKDLDNINPLLLKKQTPIDKKSYRLGMKSFFSYFQWTGKKPGKEFRNGEDLTRLIIDDLYINAVKYYVLAISNEDQDDDEEDSSEGEELDLSDIEDKRETKKQKTE